jgi:hypothetical protein
VPSNVGGRTISARDYADHPAFTKGVIDARAGRGFRREYETWSIEWQSRYETGRQLAQIFPRNLKTRTSGGKPTQKVVETLCRNIGVLK